MNTPPPEPAHRDPHARRAFALHDRLWRENRYVYPVISRRSRGLSIGVNLNPDQACNFDCIYCSVDRTVPPVVRKVELAVLEHELAGMLELAASGRVFEFDPFARIPAELRRVNDIALSGDGEPTTYPKFGEACRIVARLRDAAGLPDLKIVLITNATMFHRPRVRAALALLDEHHGEVWAKLDAGTQDYYRLVDRSSIPLGRVLENIQWCARTRPTVIQSLFMKIRGQGPAAHEIDAYAGRLAQIRAGGGTIQLVQLYTVARGTTEDYVSALSEVELGALARRVRAKIPGVAVEVYP